MSADTRTAFVAETLGTGLLLAAIVGSGIMGEQLAGGNVAIALLANSLATGFCLAASILAFAPLSGAHFNPLVTLVAAWRSSLPWRTVPAYLFAQLIGAMLGVLLAHAMFDHALIALSQHVRTGYAQWLSEAVATFGLILVIARCGNQGVGATAAAVGAYIAAAYWFTASTSFANPVVTVARVLTDTFSGIRVTDAPSFILAQVLGAALAGYMAQRLDTSRAALNDSRSEPLAPSKHMIH